MKGPVVLLGPPGAGKSTAGRLVAAQLGMGFVDVDDEIARQARASVDVLFTAEGEVAFRTRELAVLDAALDGRDRIIAAGAGVVDTPRGRELLAQRALCVLLDVDARTAVSRLARSPRPWLPAGTGAVEALDVWERRELPRRERRAALAGARIEANAPLDDVIGALARAMDSLKPLHPAFPSDSVVRHEDVPAAIAAARACNEEHALLVAEERVAGLYPVDPDLTIAGGEAAKDLRRVEDLARALVSLGATRKTHIVAVGGGAVLDAVGLCAALLFRGVSWTAVPTTLLAQADAGLGGKTAVDLDGKKNLLGAFHPPLRTVLCASFLRSLSHDALRAGRAEMLKHAFLAADAPPDGSPRPDDFDVERSLAVKAAAVARDPTERGLRAVLNLGHTAAHGLEAATAGPQAMGHGEAVRHGLRVMLRLSVEHAALDPSAAERLDERVLALGALPPPGVDVDRVQEALRADKKGGSWVLLRGPGLPVLKPIPQDSVRQALRAVLAD